MSDASADGGSPAVAPRELATGWYWVRFDRADDSLTEPMPARWDGRRWESVGWAGLPLHRAQVLKPLVPPGEYQRQGAVDHHYKAVILDIERRILLGYARLRRLYAKAVDRTAGEK